MSNIATSIAVAGEIKSSTRLSQLHQPINCLYASCNRQQLMDLLRNPTVAIVGTRKPSAYGIRVTRKLTRELAGQGVTIISGLALGLDSIAHQTCVDHGGKTIAVLPSSIDNIYPRRHRQLARDITDSGGALVSEYTAGSTGPQKHNFIARNRIIAALANLIVIPEASKSSGSLHTANFGLELGIDVLAVPGSIYSPQSEGTNHLIQQGACAVTSTSDILDCLN